MSAREDIIMNKGQKTESRLLIFLISKKKVIAVCITMLFLAITFLTPVIFRSKITNNRWIYIEICYYVSQIVSALFVVLGVVIALLQYIASTYDAKALRQREMELHEKEIIDLEKDRVQRAIDLAEYYKDNILHNVFIIDSVYEDLNITEFLDKIDITNMVEFDRHELNNILKPEEIEQIANIMNSSKLIPSLINNSKIYGFAETGFKVVEVVNDETKVKKRIVCDETVLIREYANIINNSLNNAEYFAMHFTHNTADETVVYQSLHKTYLNLMKMLYYDISINNEVGEEKLYTNAIELFNIWKTREANDKMSIIEHSRENVRPGTKVRKIS